MLASYTKKIDNMMKSGSTVEDVKSYIHSLQYELAEMDLQYLYTYLRKHYC